MPPTPKTPKRQRKMRMPSTPRKRQKVVEVKKDNKGKWKVVAPKRSKQRRVIRSSGTELGGRFLRAPKANLFAKYTKNGAVTTREVGTSVTTTVTSSPVYVGHGTHANTGSISKLFFLCLVRELFERAGLEFVDFEAVIAPNMTIRVEYLASASDQSTKTTFTTTTNGKSATTIASDLQTAWEAIWGTFAGINNTYMTCAYMDIGTLTTQANHVHIDLRAINVEIFCKSDLKIQNRTNASGVDEDINSSENVANQPLFGKSYFGKGSGLLPKVQTNASFPALNVSTGTNFAGLLAYSPPSGLATTHLGEPPLPTLFTPKPKCSSASLLPGQIKYSSLTAVYRVKQKEMWSTIILADGGLGIAQKATDKYGKYHIMALEKTICVADSDSKPVVGVELNQRMGMKFNKLRKQHVAEVFQGQVFA